MKKHVLRIAALCLCLLFAAGCGRVSRYSAVGFAHSNTSKEAYMRFHSFEGTMVFRLKCDDPGRDLLRCSGSLESGLIRISCENGADLSELSSLEGGGEVAEDLPLDFAGEVTVVVTADGPCVNGDLRFTVGP